MLAKFHKIFQRVYEIWSQHENGGLKRLPYGRTLTLSQRDLLLLLPMVFIIGDTEQTRRSYEQTDGLTDRQKDGRMEGHMAIVECSIRFSVEIEILRNDYLNTILKWV